MPFLQKEQKLDKFDKSACKLCPFQLLKYLASQADGITIPLDIKVPDNCPLDSYYTKSEAKNVS
jgi:hypothetical protein